MAANVLYVASDNRIHLKGLQDPDSLAYANAATVTATVTNPDGTVLSGATGIVLTLDSGSILGNYTGLLPNTVALVAGWAYPVNLVATQSGMKLTISATLFALNDAG